MNLREPPLLGTMQPSDENVIVGCTVLLHCDASEFQRSFSSSGYGWDEAMRSILGKKVWVVDRPKAGIFGLPECTPGSGQAIWWYPFAVIESVKEIGNLQPYGRLPEFLASLGFDGEVHAKATEILVGEGVTVEQLCTVIDDDELKEIGIDQTVIEAISQHRQRLHSLQVAEVQRRTRPVINTPDHYNYQPILEGVDLTDHIDFEVDASNDAHLKLSLADGGMFEVVIGGWNNSSSVLRASEQGPPLSPPYAGAVLAAGDFRR